MLGANRKPNRVLMVLENESIPADNRTWSMALALTEAGYVVTTICPKRHLQYRAAYECIEGIHIYRYWQPSGSSSLAYFVEYAVALAQIVRLSVVVRLRHGFDVIHAGNPPDFLFLVGLLYRPFGVGLVFDQHDVAPLLFLVLFGERLKGALGRAFHRIICWLERRSYQAANLVLVTNQSAARHAIEDAHCPAEKVVVVRNGPRSKRQSQALPKLEPRLQRGLLLAYLGAMGAQDGIEHALYALDYLVHVRSRQDVSLILIGDGSHALVLRSLAHELHLDDYTHFTGWLSEQMVAAYLELADVGIVPDPRNGLSEISTLVKTMEYMAMGLPVVAFDLAETRYTAQEAALYAIPNEVEDLAAKIEMLLDNATLRHQMGAFGQARIESTLNWERSKQQLLKAYAQLLCERSSSPATARLR
jgi:glycosyltransferase involved in cell wall biosynthesis